MEGDKLILSLLAKVRTWTQDEIIRLTGANMPWKHKTDNKLGEVQVISSQINFLHVALNFQNTKEI